MGLQHLYYANSLRNLIMKVCAYLPQIPNFGFDVRSVPMILEYSNFYPSVFTPIHIFFKVLQNFLRKNLFSIHPNIQYTESYRHNQTFDEQPKTYCFGIEIRFLFLVSIARTTSAIKQKAKLKTM